MSIATDKTLKKQGEIDNEPWWTNGHVLFKGKLAGEHATQENMIYVYKQALAKKLRGPLLPGKVGKAEGLVVIDLILNSRVVACIQNKFFEYTRSLDCDLYLGGDMKVLGNVTEPYIVAKRKKEVIGIIAPIRRSKK